MENFSLELMNHQLMRKLGAISAQTDSSLDQLSGNSKKFTRDMQACQEHSKKLYNSLLTIKNSFLCLSKIYESIVGASHAQKVQYYFNEITASTERLSKQALGISALMTNKLNQYQPQIKNLAREHKQLSQNIEHYKKKLALLEKGKEFDRTQRNRDKYREAKEEYDENLKRLSRKHYSFCKDGEETVATSILKLVAHWSSYNHAAVSRIRFNFEKSRKESKKNFSSFPSVEDFVAQLSQHPPTQPLYITQEMFPTSSAVFNNFTNQMFYKEKSKPKPNRSSVQLDYDFLESKPHICSEKTVNKNQKINNIFGTFLADEPKKNDAAKIFEKHGKLFSSIGGANLPIGVSFAKNLSAKQHPQIENLLEL